MRPLFFEVLSRLSVGCGLFVYDEGEANKTGNHYDADRQRSYLQKNRDLSR